MATVVRGTARHVYVASQLMGALLACLFLWTTLGKVGMLGATEPGAGIGDLQAALVEVALTAGLVSTIRRAAQGTLGD